MPTKNVNLSDQQTRFIRKSVNRGRYRNASEVVRAGLRLLEQAEQEDRLKLEALRRIAARSFNDIERGKYEEVDASDLDQFMDRADARVRTAGRR